MASLTDPEREWTVNEKVLAGLAFIVRPQVFSIRKGTQT